MAQMKFLSPAKINLFLQVVGKRSDGYHELISLMTCVSLYDILTFDFSAKNTRITCSHPQVPEDESNLVLKAVRVFEQAYDRCGQIDINLAKNIPVAAGLGGGSSNAAAVLAVLNRYYGYPFTSGQLSAMGLTIGADVPFFLFNKPALVSGIGEKITPYERVGVYHVLLINPGIQVSTAWVYRNVNLGLTKCKQKLNTFLFNGHGFDAENHLCNDLETVTASAHHEIGKAKEALLMHGAIGSLMSGSGPTVFGLFSDLTKARKAEQVLSQNDKWQLFLADIIV
jgi:4-diphosphocytidyl-2-C-methyl-D-erythritol kinase